MTLPLNAHRGGLYVAIPLPAKLTGALATNSIGSGDLVAQASGKLVPAASWPYVTDEATTQTAFAAAFQGVSNGRSRAGFGAPNDLTVEVNAEGYFDVNVDALGGGYALGDMLGVSTNGADTVLSTLKKVTTLAKAVARVVKPSTIGTAAGQLRVELLNTPQRR